MQFGRKCNLVLVSGSDGIDVSQLRVTFNVKRTDTQTPNEATIRVYNLSHETLSTVQRTATEVLLQAGYEDNYGVIFRGNIRRFAKGRLDGVDSYLELDCADGDTAYNTAVVNTTLAKGATHGGVIREGTKAMAGSGVTGQAPSVGSPLPRGKVLYGSAKDILRSACDGVGLSWSVQNGAIQFVPNAGYLANTAVVLNSQTGLIGSPEQTNDGLKCRCLLNPKLTIGGAVQIDQSIIRTNTDSDVSSIQADGLYKILEIEYTGDTRGETWYCDLVCVDIDSSTGVARNG